MKPIELTTTLISLYRDVCELHDEISMVGFPILDTITEKLTVDTVDIEHNMRVLDESTDNALEQLDTLALLVDKALAYSKRRHNQRK